MPDLGIRQLGSTIDWKFSTQTTAGVPTTLSGSPVIKIYRSNDTSTEQTTGLTLTVDFDSVTGLNHVNVVTTASSFYTADTDFAVVITTGTVSAQSVAGTVIGTFRLSSVRHDGALDTGTAAAIANGTITLRSGHGIATVGSVLVVLTGGTDALGKSRIATYSGSGDVFNVDPAWNVGGEALPSGTITYRVYPAPPAPTSTVPTVTLAASGSAALTESYGTDGSAQTLNQLLYEIRALLGEKAISGVTMTTYKLDGTTTAATYTLDSSSLPTTIHRTG